METPKHGNASRQKLTQKRVWAHFLLFQESFEIPQKLKSIEGFPNILNQFPLYLHLTRFRFFLCPFPLFLKSVYGFQKSFKSSDWFPLFLGPFLVFKLSFKFSVC